MSVTDPGRALGGAGSRGWKIGNRRLERIGNDPGHGQFFTITQHNLVFLPVQGQDVEGPISGDAQERGKNRSARRWCEAEGLVAAINAGMSITS